MKVRKQKLLSILLCAALTVTNIVSEGFQVSANELLPEQWMVVEDSTETESEMLETQASEAETGGNLPSEETESTGNEKAKETETETKEEETESDLKETEAATWETESGLDEIETETEKEAYPNALIPFEIGGTDIFAGIGAASFYSVNKEQPKYDPRTEAPEEMTSVKDQNPWGTCWSFAVMETLENSMVRQGLADNTIDLSERHLAYFVENSGSDALGNASDDSITSSPSSTYLRSGGNTIGAAVRLMNWQGAAAESKYEYSNTNTEPAALSSSAAQDIEVMAHDIYFVPTKEASKEEKISAVKKLIAEYGCVAWSYKHLNNCYNKENAAYYCPQKGTNHAITVVGWDDDFPAEKFSSVVDGQISRPAENGAWIVKNSWGSDWGEDGYFYISYEDGSLGSGNPAAVSVAASKNEYDHNYFYGNTASLPRLHNPYFKVSQVYQVKNEREQLKAVSVLIYSDQADYSIQIYKNPILEDGVVKDPESGEPMLQTPETGKTGYTGLYTIDLSEPVIFEKGDYISIVIDFSRPGLNLGSQYAYLYTDESSTDSGQFSSGESYTVVNNNVTHEGQSFYCTRKTVESGWVWYDAQAENFNFRINALTVDTDQPVPVKAPVFDPEAGIIEEGQSVTIKADNDAEIYYTLDGSEPTAETGMKYSKPLEITEDVTIKAAAVRDGVKSKAAEAVYKYYKMKLILSETEAELAKAGTHQLEVLQKPTAGEGVEKQVSWESSDLNIVTVSDNGVITGVNEGTAVITAMSEDYKGNKVTANCQVTVTKDFGDNIASGEYKENGNDITWVIDVDGKLTVEGTGDFSDDHYNTNRAPWYDDRESIKYAEVNIIGMTDATGMFFNCSNLTSVTLDQFDTAKVAYMSSMFSGCSSLTSLDVSGFKTSNVINMSSMFSGCSSLTSLDVSGFDTSNVTNMHDMFWMCRSLTSLDVSGFDTSNVTDMSYMFDGCNRLTSLDVSGFDTSEVTDMNDMFFNCYSLISLDVSGFDTGKVRNMYNMFRECRSLTSLDVSGFDTSNVVDMFNMFGECGSLTSLDVSGFDTSNVIRISCMFDGCSHLTSLNLSKFDISKVTDASHMFPEGSNELQTIRTPYNLKVSVALPAGSWYQTDGTQATELSKNLDHSILLKKDEIPIFSILKVTKTKINYVYNDTVNIDDLTVLYYDADGMAHKLGRSDYTTNAGEIDMSTEGVKTLVITYGEMTATIKLTVTGEKSGVIASGEYKENGNNITWVIDADGKLTVEGTGDFVAPRYMNYDRAPWYNDRASIESAEINVTGMTNASCMFRDCIDLASIDMSSFDTSNVTDMESMFSGCGSLTSIDVSSFVTRSVTNMDRMFCGCGSLTSIDLSSFDTRKVTDMGYMFAGCSSLASIDMNSFATGNDANIEMMFYNCSSLTSIDLSSFNTSSVTKMNGMFYGCSSLTSIDLNGFDTRSITDMRWLFEDCSSLTSIDVSSFDTSSVTSMQSMFYNCSSLVNIDVSNFDTSSVTDMNAIFLGCSSLTSIDVGNFDTSSVTNMSLMFYGCSSLESIDMSSFSASSATNMDAMFSRCSKLLTLRTPYNLKLSVALPSGTWYQTDGTQITELPQNLDHSILIKKDEIPIVSAIKVAKTKTNYVCGETINVDDLTVTYYDADSVARELEVSDYTTNADKIDMSTVGKKTLIITYHDGGNIFTDEIALTVTLENIIANGEYKENGNNITWIIDADGKLTVTGTGDFSSSRANDRAPWYENRGSIISAEINVTDMVNATGMFYRCENLTSVDLSKFNTGNVTDMYCMFSGCSKLTSLDLSNFDTSNVIDMGCMFQYCSSLTHIDVSNFDTSNVISMWAMFDGCSSLTSLDVSSFDTSHATTGAMFKECSSLTNLDVSGFDTSQSTRMDHMFDGCSSLTSLDVSGFDTSRSTLMRWMFFNCSSLTSLDLSNFDTSQVTDMDAMLSGCSTLMTIHTPCNLTLSVSLPRESDKVWYDPDGTEITELPQNLNHSIIITQKSATSDDNIASGSYKNITWVIDADGKLTVEGTGDFTGDSGSTSRAPWYNYRESIKYAEVNVTGMTNASNMFIFCDNLASIDLSKFDTSQVTNMNDMFYGCSNLTSIDLSKFDTGQVTDMRGMFSLCSNLSSLDLSNFNTSKVTDMELMFHDCNKLTDLDVSGFDTSQVTNMRLMFSQCKNLTDLNVSGFETSQVTDMYGMFSQCSNLINLDVSKFNTSQVTNMHWMFYDCSKLASLDVGNFDTSQVTDMSRMFSGCNKLTSLDVSSFNTGQVTDMSYMFYECQNLTSLDLSGFATGNVTRMNSMFYNCSSLTSLDVSGFTTGNVISMAFMFYGCEGLTSLDVSGFATGNVTDMEAMLSGCKGLTNLDVSGFATDNVTDMSRMFSDCEGLTSLDVSDFVTDSVTNMSGMFHGCKGLTSLDVSGFVTDNITNMSGMFEGCKRLTSLDVSSFVTDNVMDMSYMFYGCERLTGLDVSGFATRNVTSMYFMFNGCKRLTSLDVSGFTTGNVTSMGSMFSGCEGLTSLDMSGFTTDNVTDMGWMFYGCEELTSLDMSSFVTDNVTDMSCMFRGCKGLTSLDVSGFVTENATDMGWMFYGCEGLMSLDVSGFDTVNVASMEHMFSDCSSLVSIDISNFDVGKVEDTYGIFNGCSNLTTIYTPCNLKQSVSLPTAGTEEAWYQPDGTAITELPQNLSYSIMLTKNQKSAVRSLSAQKIRTAYNCGEELKLNDLTVTYTAENGVDTEVTDYTTNAAEIDMSMPGIKTLAITYEGITVELELIVTYLLDEGTVEVILPDETYIYDGTAKQPEPIVTAGKTNTKLISGKDYTLSYENNIDAGTAFVIITGQNDYQGTLKSSFRINKAVAPETVEVNIYTPCDKAQEGQTFDIAGRYGEYGRITGYEIKDIVEDNEIGGTVFAGMPYIQDGILYYDTNTGKGGDSAAVTVEVSFANYESALLNVVVEFTDERAVYTVRFELAGHGQAIAPVTVLETGSLIDEPMQPEAEGFRFMGWYKDQSCTEAWDFDTDTVQDNITLYAGWLVEAADLEGADLYIQEIQNQIYTGSALKPSIRVYAADGDTRLKEGKDYTIKYFNNKNADQPALALAGGTSQTGEEGDNGFTKNLAYVIIKGKGNYKGTIYRNFHIDAASIAGNDGEPAKGFTLKYKEQLLHNASKAQKPFQSIRYKKSMKAGTDYELKLSVLEAYDSEGNRLERGNVIADADSFVPLIPAGYKGTFLLTITGLGNYKGSIDKTVCVTDKKHLLKNATVSMGKNCKNVRYTGEAITLRPAYYDASQKKYYAVDDDGLVSTQAEPDGNNVFVVKAGGKCLKYGEDYTLSYTNNQAVGTATMTISGKGEYLGSKDVTFRITGMAFNAKNISVDGFEASMEYTGKPLTQNGVRLKSMGSSTENSIELTYGKDYTVNYKNNLKKGTATMTFTANPSSGYTGRFKKTFKITAASLTDTVKVTAAFPLEDHIADGEVISLEGKVAYEKAGAKPSGRIRLYNKDGILLKEGIDYSVSYAYNKVVTTADTTNFPVMNLKGKGNYTGNLSVNFRITEASMEDNENLAVTAAEVAFYKNKADNYTYQPKITVMDGKYTLNSRTDYMVRYERCTQAEIKTYLDALQGGRATEEELEQLKPYAVIEAKEGNGYVGSIRKELTVYRTKLTGNNLYIVINADTSQITYTGEQVKPEVTVYYGDSKAVKKAKNRKEIREKVLTDKTGDYCLTKLSLKISENGIGDYTLSYGTNVTAGKNKGNVTVIGTGLYGGRVKAKFTINSKDVYTASK